MIHREPSVSFCLPCTYELNRTVSFVPYGKAALIACKPHQDLQPCIACVSSAIQFAREPIQIMQGRVLHEPM
jgi:hypothetical protein